MVGDIGHTNLVSINVFVMMDIMIMMETLTVKVDNVYQIGILQFRGLYLSMK